MYRRLLVFILVLSTLHVPAIISINSGHATLTDDRYQRPMIESQLKMEIRNLDDTPLAGSRLASDYGASAILRFHAQLTPAEIQYAESLGIEFKKRGGQPVHIGGIYLVKVSDVIALEELDRVGLIQASSGSKQFFPSIASSVPAIKAPEVWNDLEDDGKGIDGSGTRVAVIDTGASWLHPSLWRKSSDPFAVVFDGSDFYIDIDNDSIADSDEGPIATITGQGGALIDYGEDYMFIDLNDNGRFDFAAGERWLGGVDADDNGLIDLNSEKVVILGESKVAILYDQITSKVYVRGVNLTDAISVVDTNGHGTHVASIIAGGQIGMTDYVGVAPGADLIIIKSSLSSEDVLDGIAFAAENDADVINMSFSSYLGFLDGTDYEDLAITEVFMQSGVLSTLAAGNLGGRPKHASFNVPSGGEESALLAVSNPPDYSFLNVLWQSEDDDEHVILTPPNSDEKIDLGAFNEIVSNPFVLEHDNISAYVFPDRSIKGMNRVIVQVSAQDHFWDMGSWTLTVSNPEGDDITIHAYAWDNNWAGLNLKFTSKLDFSHTISSPGTADIGITVTAYNEVTLGLSSTSSIGPRIDGIPKPVVSAPGDAIRAARNSVTSLWATRSGTSMAAPHAAGVVALIRDASEDTDGWRTLSALLQGSGGVDGHYETPSPSFGFGFVNPVWSVQHVLSPTGFPAWNGIPYNAVDVTDPSVDSGLDILNVSVYLTNETTWFRVGLRGSPDYSGTNVITLNWDTDNSMSTGLLGVDMKVNISNNVANIYTWQGGMYVAAGTTSWSNSSNFVYVAIEHDLGTDFGRIEFFTGNATNTTVDETSTVQLTDQWAPLIETLDMESSDELYTFNLRLSDKDTTSNQLSVQFDVIDGSLTVLNSTTKSALLSIQTQVDTSEFSSLGTLSLMIMLTDGTHDLTFLPVILSGGGSVELRIVEGHLDQSVVRIGWLVSERITGNVTVEGHLLAAEVRLSLQLSYGLMFNITLSGDNGEYQFDISPSGMTSGVYDVYAVAISIGGEEVSLLLGQLTIAEDYSYVILIGGIGLVAGVVLLYLRKTRFSEVS